MDNDKEDLTKPSKDVLADGKPAGLQKEPEPFDPDISHTDSTPDENEISAAKDAPEAPFSDIDKKRADES